MKMPHVDPETWNRMLFVPIPVRNSLRATCTFRKSRPKLTNSSYQHVNISHSFQYVSYDRYPPVLRTRQWCYVTCATLMTSTTHLNQTRDVYVQHEWGKVWYMQVVGLVENTAHISLLLHMMFMALKFFRVGRQQSGVPTERKLFDSRSRNKEDPKIACRARV